MVSMLMQRGSVNKACFRRKPVFYLILLNNPLCIGFIYANYLVEWSNSLKDIFTVWSNSLEDILSGDNFPANQACE